MSEFIEDIKEYSKGGLSKSSVGPLLNPFVMREIQALSDAKTLGSLRNSISLIEDIDDIEESPDDIRIPLSIGSMDLGVVSVARKTRLSVAVNEHAKSCSLKETQPNTTTGHSRPQSGLLKVLLRQEIKNEID